jgi:hypothetical protein
LTIGIEFLGVGGSLCEACVRDRSVPSVEPEFVMKVCEESGEPVTAWCGRCQRNYGRRAAARERTLLTRLTHRAVNIEVCERTVGTSIQIKMQLARRRNAMGLAAPSHWGDGWGRVSVASREEEFGPKPKGRFGPLGDG